MSPQEAAILFIGPKYHAYNPFLASQKDAEGSWTTRPQGSISILDVRRPLPPVSARFSPRYIQALPRVLRRFFDPCRSTF